MLANIGYDGSLKWLKELYVDGKVSKEDYDGALWAYQAAVNAAKSRVIGKKQIRFIIKLERSSSLKEELREVVSSWLSACRHLFAQSV